jgi:hypothetical protein
MNLVFIANPYLRLGEPIFRLKGLIQSKLFQKIEGQYWDSNFLKLCLQLHLMSARDLKLYLLSSFYKVIKTSCVNL